MDADKTPDAEAGVATTSDATVVDTGGANPDAAPALLDGGRPFLCAGCICDGVDHYCEIVSGGTNMPLAPLDGGGGFFGDAGACGSSSPSCLTFPSQCQPEPSCDCLVASSPFPNICTCDWDPSGGGLAVTCFVP